MSRQVRKAFNATTESGSTGAMTVGCAGWSIPTARKDLFPLTGSHLERYSQRFNGVEINSSFYRPHQPKTYARWAETVPEGFRFAVKAPRSITHEKRLQEADADLKAFLEQIRHLGNRLGPLLFQLPPSLRCDLTQAREFLERLRELFDQDVVLEPRHRSWLDLEALTMLTAQRISVAAADPPLETELRPRGHPSLAYYRLHGSPTMYYSGYSDETLSDLADRMTEAQQGGTVVWCVFDNTAAGAAQLNAVQMQALLTGEGQTESATRLSDLAPR